jgi:hypothetical protein
VGRAGSVTAACSEVAQLSLQQLSLQAAVTEPARPTAQQVAQVEAQSASGCIRSESVLQGVVQGLDRVRV